MEKVEKMTDCQSVSDRHESHIERQESVGYLAHVSATGIENGAAASLRLTLSLALLTVRRVRNTRLLKNCVRLVLVLLEPLLDDCC